MKYNVARTVQLAYYSYFEQDFLTWIKLWPTQFLLVVLEINFSKKLKTIFEIPAHVAKAPRNTTVGVTHQNKFRSRSPNRP